MIAKFICKLFGHNYVRDAEPYAKEAYPEPKVILGKDKTYIISTCVFYGRHCERCGEKEKGFTKIGVVE